MKISAIIRSAERSLSVIGLGNGHAGRHLGCENVLSAVQNSKLFSQCSVPFKWKASITETISGRQADALNGVIKNSENLSEAVGGAVRNGDENILVVGGDHSCAIGTWSGVASAMRPHGDVGLIWVDAHMDAHTIETSPTKNLHGTPVAHLLGFGNERLRKIADSHPKIRPQNLCMIGIRSFETPELELLSRLGVRIFFDSEVQRRGVADCMNEAIDLVSRDTAGFGMSIDLDAFRWRDAPAVGTPEPGGIHAAEFVDFLRNNSLERLIATEIVEFMPHQDDVWRRTERLFVDLVESIYLPKVFAEEFLQEERRQEARA